MIFRGAGGADVIAEGSIDVREPGIGEIQVDIVAAGLNRADIMQRRGMYPAPTGSPADVPGMEFSGRVVACGGGATMWKVGDEVMAIVGGGAMAKRITLHEREAMPVPRGVALVDAAAISGSISHRMGRVLPSATWRRRHRDHSRRGQWRGYGGSADRTSIGCEADRDWAQSDEVATAH